MTQPDPRPEGAEVCSLPKPQLGDRVEQIRREILPHLRRSEQQAGAVVWHFAPDPALRERIDQFVSFERSCCGGLSFELDAGEDALQLRISGPGSEAFAALAEAGPAGPVPAEASGKLRRALQAGGLGFGAAFFLFCVVPIAAASLGGAALAAHLAQLDDPRVIAGGTLLLALPAWWLLKRRQSV